VRVRALEVAIVLAGLGIGGGLSFVKSPAEPTSVSFLSVGQGDCSVIRHAGYTILIDAGPATDSFDAGQRIVAPKLKELGVRRIDLLVLTHPDSDHIGGLPGLASRIPIGNIAVPAYFRGHPTLSQSLQAARFDSAKVVWMDRSARLATEGLAMDFRLPRFVQGSEDNEGSPFIQVRINGKTFLFTGDASEETELAMMGRGHWRADVFKAGHHGSGGSSSTPWLKAVDPTSIVVSCGIDNPFGHPAESFLERAKDVGAELLRTDRMGDIHFERKEGRWVAIYTRNQSTFRP